MRQLWRTRRWSMLTIVWAIVTIIIALYLQFTHIDMTRTRLFTTYWPTWMLLIVAGLICSVMRGLRE